MPKHFKRLGENLFCNDYLMNTALANTNPFLIRLDKEVNFEEMWHEKLLKTYKGEAEMGQPPYRPELMLKMLFLAYLFNVSEREIERTVNDSISMKAFLRMALEEKAPDHSSLTYFKNRILANDERKDTNLFKELFDDIILLAQRKGIDLKYTQVIDSTHTVADVNTKKDKQRQKPLSEDGEGKPPRDPDARWGVKKIKKVKTVNGERVEIKDSYFGYKSHFSGNAF
jgi:transposase